MTFNSSVRPSPIAGSWYPGDPGTLRAEVDQYIADATLPPIDGNLIALISPHAGYRYSGPTAGYAYRAIQGMSFDIVVVVSPLHEYRPEPFLTSTHGFYATPLGNVNVQQSLLQDLDAVIFKSTGIHLTPLERDREHSLEIQLPFLQCSLAAPFTLLPLMVREHQPAQLKGFSLALAQLLKGKKVLLVASTDLSHFYPESQAEQLDEYMLEQIRRFSPEGVLQAEIDQKGFACGDGAVAVVLWTARELGANKVIILHHSTSAHATGDSSQVVGYGAAIITK